MGDWLQEIQRLHHRARRLRIGAFSLEHRLQRLAFEPLKHHEGNPFALRRHGGPYVAGLANGRTALREVEEQSALAHEAVEQLAARTVAEHPRLKGLDGHRALPDAVLGSVNDREGRFSNGLDYVVLAD